MLTYTLDGGSGMSLYEQLYRCIRSDIERGAIAPDERLPSKRALSRHLGVSVITVEGAYRQLVAEGYVRAEPRRGHFANPLAPVPAPSVPAPALPTQPAQLAPVPQPDAARPAPIDLTGGATPPDLFPFAAWARATREVLSHEPQRLLVEGAPSLGTLRLRQALAGHLRSYRGMEVQPGQILVGAGAQTLYGLIAQLLGRGGRFAVEEPGYPRLTALYRAQGIDLAHVGMDESGIDMAALAASGARVVHLMPSHQLPLGLVTPAGRRYELLGWAAAAPGRFIIEDDYDCEFRFSGRPIPAMQSLDGEGRVVYVNTFSRSLGPSVRVAYAVLPEHLARRFERELGFYSNTVSTIDQLVLARLIERGDFERHLNRARSRYRAVRDELLARLEAGSLGPRMTVEGADAGLHFVLRLDSDATATAIARAARKEGVRIAPLGSFYREAPAPGGRPAFVVGYSALQREDAATAAAALARAVAAAERAPLASEQDMAASI